MEPNNGLTSIIKMVYLLTMVVVGFGLLCLALTLKNAVSGSLDNHSSTKKEWTEGQKDSLKIVLKEFQKAKQIWLPPSENTLRNDERSDLIRYGKDLIANTSFYLGPQGKMGHLSNGMNCQNCHLDAGTKVFGNNYSAVASTYPKFRERSGTKESIEKRVNDCLERSLNGKKLDSLSHEMRAIVAYVKWLGIFVKKGDKPKGSGLVELPLLKQAADPEKGKIVYDEKCQSCHGAMGQGLLKADNIAYQYPPLWGINSYNIGAGLYRLSRFAGYVKANMPFGATYNKPQLTDEEAWNVAAFVNSMPRPTKDLSKDWPKIAGKPFDNPFGPYADSFSEEQHKFGPFGPIKKAMKSKN